MAWRNQSGRSRTEKHGIVRIPQTTALNLSITGRLGEQDTIVPFYSEIRGVDGLTFKGQSTIINSTGEQDGILRIEGGSSDDISTFSIQLSNGINLNGPIYQTSGATLYTNEDGTEISGNYFSAPQHIFNGVGDTGICDVIIRGNLNVTESIYDLSVVQLIESLSIRNEGTTDLSSSLSIFHSKDAYGNILSVYLDTAKNVDASFSESEDIHYLANSAFIIDGTDNLTEANSLVSHQGSTDQPGHVRMFRGATILKTKDENEVNSYNKSFAETNHTLDIYGGVYLYDGLITNGVDSSNTTGITISGESPGFYMHNTELDASIVSIDSSGNVDIYGYIDVSGNADLSGNLEVSGDAFFYGDLTVDTSGSIGGNVNIYKNLNVFNNLSIDGSSVLYDVSVNKNIDIEGSAVIGEDVVIYGSLEVNDDTIINNNANINGDLIVLGNFVANNQTTDTLTISGNTIINSGLSVTGRVDISSDLTVDGFLIISELPQTTGNVNFEENVFIEKDLRIKENLYVENNVTIGGYTEIAEYLQVNNDVTIGGKLSIDGSLNLENDISLTGDLTIQDMLTVENNVFIGNDLTIGGNLNANDLDISNSVTINGELETNFLTIDGSANISSDATFSENLVVIGNVDITGDVIVNNDTLIDGLLTVANATVHQDLEVLGSVSILNNVTLDIDLSVNSTLYCANLDVSGEIYTDKLTVAELTLDEMNVANFSCQNIDICNQLIVRTDLSVNKMIVDDKAYFNDLIYTQDISALYTHIVNTLTVDGSATINVGLFNSVKVNEDISVNKNIYVDGSFIINTLILQNATIEELTVINEANIDGSLNVDGNLNVSSQLTVVGDISCNSNLNVTGNAYVSGSIDVSYDVIVTGSVTADAYKFVDSCGNRLVITDDDGYLTTSAVSTSAFNNIFTILWGEEYTADVTLELPDSFYGDYTDIFTAVDMLQYHFTHNNVQNNRFINTQDISGYLTLQYGGIFILGVSGEAPISTDCSAAFYIDASGANIGYSEKLYLRSLDENAGAGLDRFCFDNSGNWQFLDGTNGTEVIGEIENLGTSVKYKTTSDRRLKTNIIDFTPDEGMEYCMKLRPRRFEWISDNRPDIGFIAQEIAENNAVPEICKQSSDDDGLGDDYPEKNGKPDYYTVDYAGFTPIAIAAIQKLNAQLEELETLVHEKLNK